MDSQARHEQDRCQPECQESRTEPVNHDPPGHRRINQVPADHGQGDHGQKNAGIERETPRDVIDGQASQQGSADAGHRENRAYVRLVPAALSRRDHVTDDHVAEGDQAGRSGSLHGPASDELADALAEACCARSQDEQKDGDLHHPPATIEIRQLAVEGNGDRRREHVGRQHPGKHGERAHLADDGRQSRGHDRVVHGGDGHGQQQRYEGPLHFRCQPRCLAASVGMGPGSPDHRQAGLPERGDTDPLTRWRDLGRAPSGSRLHDRRWRTRWEAARCWMRPRTR